MSTGGLSQGLQSCLEPPFLEPCISRVKLRVAKPNDIPPPENQPGSSFLQILCNNTPLDDTQQVYVHPLVKRFSSMLSDKSLEMCTESLGNETGTVIGDSWFPIPTPHTETKPRSKLPDKKICSFPPPISSITGPDGIHVKPYREGGRLILVAFTMSSCSNHFHAERGGGRFRLQLLNFDPMEEEEEDDEEEYDDDDIIDDDDGDQEEEEDDDEDDEEEEEEQEGNGVDVDETEATKLPGPSSCKQGEHTNAKPLLNWEPYWVAS